MTDTPAGERPTRPFADVLQELHRGATHRELSDTLQQLIEAVEQTGRKGSLVLTINVSKSKASRMVEVASAVKAKVPEEDRPTSMFFVDKDFNLRRDDPVQAELPLGPVRAAEPSNTERAAQ